MASKTFKINKAELIELIDHAVEKKLLELFGDPDAGLIMKKTFHARLLRQKRSVSKGKRGQDFNRVIRRPGIE